MARGRKLSAAMATMAPYLNSREWGESQLGRSERLLIIATGDIASPNKKTSLRLRKSRSLEGREEILSGPFDTKGKNAPSGGNRLLEDDQAILPDLTDAYKFRGRRKKLSGGGSRSREKGTESPSF